MRWKVSTRAVDEPFSIRIDFDELSAEVYADFQANRAEDR